MENALIIGASGGIGGAVAHTLRGQGVAVTTLSRGADGLDVTEEATVAAHLGRLNPGYDLIFVATGALGTPEKAIRALDAEGMASQFAVNTIGPALVLKHGLRLMPRDRRAVFAALSARVGSIGDNALGGWYSYRAAKAALNQILHTAAIEIHRTHAHAVVAALHPGTVATPFTEGYGHDKQSPEQAAASLLNVLARLTPADSGSFHDHNGLPVPW